MDLLAQSLDGQDHYFSVDTLPDRCPQCHTAVHPKLVSQHISSNKSEAYLTCLCTNRKCLRPFIATYRRRSLHGNDYSFTSARPRTKERSTFPQSVVEISPSFCEIYGQVESAAAEDLDQLVGIGLRKALEFLIKDFSKSQHPGEEDLIERMQLAKCIDNYVADQNVLQCAKRAAWIGNDETHYIRKWNDKDVSDLQLLVRLTVNWIDNHLLTKKYLDEMPGGA